MMTLLADCTTNCALTPPILADVIPPKLVPVTVTAVPTFPELGEKLCTLGDTDLEPTE